MLSQLDELQAKSRSFMVIFGKASCHVLSESLVLLTSPVDTFKQIRTTANGSLFSIYTSNFPSKVAIIPTKWVAVVEKCQACK
jgi:hypothetical protein